MEQYNPINTQAKIIILGDGTVGKSSITQRFAKGIFTDEYKKTLGVDFLMKKRKISNLEEVEFLIWDTAGQEYYDSITRKYYKGADAAAIVFSVNNIDSFKSIKKWKEKIYAECGRIPLIIVRNKIDLINDENNEKIDKNKFVSEKETNELSSEMSLEYVNVSVKLNINVNEVFDTLGKYIINNIQKVKEIEHENKNLNNQDNKYITEDYSNKNAQLTAKSIVVNHKLNETIKKNKKFFC